MKHRLLLGSLFFGLVVILACSSRHFGLTWDECSYFDFSDRIWEWFTHGLKRDAGTLQSYWAFDTYRNPHPPFMKIVSMLGSRMFAWVGYPLSYRMGHIVFESALLTGCVSILAEFFGSGSAGVALGFILLQPRFFGELLVATTDAPIALGWLFMLLLSWKISLVDPTSSQRQWLRITLYVTHGLITATKFTGFVAIFPVLLFHAIRRDWKETGRTLVSIPVALLILAMFSPERWHSPLQGILSFLTYPLVRGHIIQVGTYYLGTLYAGSPPWHYLPVMIGTTLPPLFLLLLALSPFSWKDSLRKRFLVAVLPSLGFWMFLGLLPATPKHDGLRQFASLLPLLGLLSWVGWLGLREAVLRWQGWRRFPGFGLLGLPILFGLFATVSSHPFELSYYNELIGGLKGAEASGFEISYYLEAVTPEVLNWLNRSPGRTLVLAPDWPHLFLAYQKHGVLRSDLQIYKSDSIAHPSLFVIVRRRATVDDQDYQAVHADFEIQHEGVSILKAVSNLDRDHL